MRELDKGLAIALRGPEADAYLASFRHQVEEWGVALPSSEVMIWDFGLGQFEKFGVIESWIANEVEAGYCGKYLFVFDGQTCPMHGHREKHETFFVVKGRVSMTCAGKTCEMSPGDVLAVAPGEKHAFTGIGPSLLLELSTPCIVDDNHFEDTNIPIGGNHVGGQPDRYGDRSLL